jgi:hypothetical protein
MKNSCEQGHDQIVSAAREVAEVSIPSNGQRGSKHVAAYKVSSPLYWGSQGIIEWECPVDGCEQVDSVEPWEYPEFKDWEDGDPND